MFTPFFKTLGIKGLALIALILAVLFWIKWTVEASATLSANETTITSLKQEVSTLREEVQGYVSRQALQDELFEDIDSRQTDLLCAARYQQPLLATTPSLPIIKEVTVYRDKLSKCPSPVSEDQVTTASVALQPVDEEIAIGVLDNNWRAYCAAVNQEDPICQPSL